MSTPPTDPQPAAAPASTAPPSLQASPAPAPDAAVEAGRGALFIGVAKAFFMVSGFLQQTLLARFVTVADYGAFGVVNSVVSVVNNTAVQFTVQSVSRFAAAEPTRVDAVKRAGLRLQVLVGAVLGLAFFLGAPWLASFEGAPHYARYFRIAAAIPFLYALYAVFIGAVNGQRLFRVQAGFDMTFSATKTVLLLAGAYLFGVAGALGGFALAAVVILALAARFIGVGRAPEVPFAVSRLGSFMAGVGVYNGLLNVALLYDQPLLHHLAAAAGREAAIVAGLYQAIRSLALLPYQALIVVTFVIFPLVSRATFAEDREATRAYVTQTLRYALILAAAMAVPLAARPSSLLRVIYGPLADQPALGEGGARALPILVAGECCLALLSIACAIFNAAGSALTAIVLMAVTVAVGVGAAYILVPAATGGPAELVAAASATAAGMAAGLVVGLIALFQRFRAFPPLGSLARVAAAGALAVFAGRLLPGHGKLASLLVTALVGVVFLAALVALGEFGPADRAKFRRILRLG